MTNFNIPRTPVILLTAASLIGASACGETTQTQAPPIPQEAACEIKPTGTGLKIDFEIIKKSTDFGANTEHVFSFGDNKTGSEKGNVEDHTFAGPGFYDINAGYRDYFSPEDTYVSCTPIGISVSAGAIAVKPPKDTNKKKPEVAPSARATGFSTVAPTSTTSASRPPVSKTPPKPPTTTTTTTTRPLVTSVTRTGNR